MLRAILVVMSIVGAVACAQQPKEAATVAASSGNAERWQKLWLDDRPVGLRSLHEYCNAQHCVSEEVLTLSLQQPGEPVEQAQTRLRFVETPDGRPLQALKQQQSAAASHRLTLNYQGARAWFSQGEGRRLLPADKVAQFPHQQRRSFAANAQLGQLVLQEWSFGLQRTMAVRYRWQKIDQPFRRSLSAQLQPWQDELYWRIQRYTEHRGQWHLSARYYADKNFVVLAQHSFSAGQSMWLLPCDKACRAEPLAAMDHVYQRLLRSPYRISEAALRGKIRYRLSGLPASWVAPQSGEQRAKKAGDEWLLTVCQHCFQVPPPSAAELDALLEPSYWLSSRHPEIVAAAARVVGDDDISSRAKMQRLTRFVGRHMDEVATYSGYATAAQAMLSGRGDCTEHALLLAALARAAGIPSRVVMGLAYNNERFMGRRFVFVPHMWVQAFTGEGWESFDSGLGPFSAGHIALAINAGDQRDFLAMNALLPDINILSAAQLRGRPGPP